MIAINNKDLYEFESEVQMRFKLPTAAFSDPVDRFQEALHCCLLGIKRPPVLHIHIKSIYSKTLLCAIQSKYLFKTFLPFAMLLRSVQK